ncbi:MAG: hypothetical protein ACE5OS_14850, partial [Anaerolineae bacterium]
FLYLAAFSILSRIEVSATLLAHPGNYCRRHLSVSSLGSKCLQPKPVAGQQMAKMMDEPRFGA